MMHTRIAHFSNVTSQMGGDRPPNQLHQCCSYSGGIDVHHSRADPSEHAPRRLAGDRRRVSVLAARPDALRGRPIIRFVRNDQRDVLFHRLTLPELFKPR